MSDAWLWGCCIELLGLASLPLASGILRNLPDRGWALAKTLGVLVWCFALWFVLTLPAALPGPFVALALPYARATIIAFLLLYLALMGWLWRGRWREIVAFARSQAAYVLLVEALFAGAFALMLWIRAFNPDIYGTEKPMDEAFITAIMRSPHLPPNDPWLSGYTLNYYYFGHFIVATLAKLLGTDPAVAFNLAIGLLFALMAVNLFGVTSNIVAFLRLHRQRRAAGWRLKPRLRASGHQTRLRGFPSPDGSHSNQEASLNLAAGAPFGFAAVLLSLVFGDMAGASLWLDKLGAGVSFGAGVQNVLAVALTGVSVAGLIWSAAPLVRRWRGAAQTGLSRARTLGLVVFGVTTVALLPWCISRLASIGQWYSKGWPLISNWLHHPLLWQTYDWWSPSRGVRTSPTDYQNITEFPVFSFLLADLHAHVLALPFTVLAIGLAFNLLLARGAGLAAFGAGRGERLLVLLSVPLMVGSLYMLNGWDLPTYAGLVLLCFATQQWRAHRRRFSVVLWQQVLAVVTVWLIAGFVFLLPFQRFFSSPSQGIALIPPRQIDQAGNTYSRALLPTDRTSLPDFWNVFGLFLAILAAYLLWQLALTFITRWRAAAARRAHYLYMLEQEPEETRQDALHYAPLGPLDVTLPLVMWTLLGLTLALALVYLAPTLLVTVLCLVGIVGCGILAYRRLNQPGMAFTLMLAGTGLALVATCELIYLRDVFDHGELFRMNTIFKLYYQVWTLFSLGSAVLLYELVGAGWRRSREHSAALIRLDEQSQVTRPSAALASVGSASGSMSESNPGSTASESQPDMLANQPPALPVAGWQPALHGAARGGAGSLPARVALRDGLPPALHVVGVGGKLVWMAGFAVLVLGALVYPVFAADARTGHYQHSVGLDGTHALAQLYPGDAEAIAWLKSHVEGDPVIVEATGGEYSDFARVSTFTGLPTILGWGGHEVQWRVNWLNDPTNAADFSRRGGDIDTIYTSPDSGQVLQLLHYYHASYLYVGALELQKYPKADLGRYAQFLRVVYQKDGVTIYAVS
jgi:uncharacterized membrane protein